VRGDGELLDGGSLLMRGTLAPSVARLGAVLRRLYKSGCVCEGRGLRFLHPRLFLDLLSTSHDLGHADGAQVTRRRWRAAGASPFRGSTRELLGSFAWQR